MTTYYAGPQAYTPPVPPSGPQYAASGWPGPSAPGPGPYGPGPVPPPAGGPYWGSPIPPPPPRSRTGLVLAVGGGALALLLLAGIVGVLVLGGLGGGPGGGGGGGTVAPAGAPYSYRIPSGFTTVADDELTGAGTGSHLSAVRPTTGGGGRDLVVVGTIPGAGSGLSEDEFAEQADRSVRSKATDASEPERTTVDGKAAVQYDLTLSNGVRSHTTFVLAGDAVVQVNCQQDRAADTVREGCDVVLESMSIRA